MRHSSRLGAVPALLAVATISVTPYNDGGGHVGSDVFRAKKRATLHVR